MMIKNATISPLAHPTLSLDSLIERSNASVTKIITGTPSRESATISQPVDLMPLPFSPVKTSGDASARMTATHQATDVSHSQFAQETPNSTP